MLWKLSASAVERVTYFFTSRPEVEIWRSSGDEMEKGTENEFRLPKYRRLYRKSNQTALSEMAVSAHRQ